MIYLNRLLICLLIYCSVIVSAFAQQQFDIRLDFNNVNCETGEVCYAVQLKSTSGNSWGLADQNYRIYYDASLLAFQSGSSNLGTTYQDFNLVQDVQDIDASAASGGIAYDATLGFLNYSIVLANTSTGGVTLTDDWLTTSELCFLAEGDALTNPASCMSVTWARSGVSNSYATSFVEVSEWVQEGETTAAEGGNYEDLTSGSNGSCLASECTTTPPTPTVGAYDIQLVLDNVDCSSNTVCYNVQLKSNDGNSFGLAGQNYRLYYDGALASYSSGSSALSTTSYGNFTLVENIQNQNATGAGSLNFESNLSFLNYTIVLNNTTTGGSTLDNNWLTTSQVCFEVEPVLLSDPNRCLEVVWSRDGVTNPYATSFVEVSEWVQEGETQVATGGVYSDLSNNNNDACLADACETDPVGSYDIQLVLDDVDCSSNTVCYNVQLKSNDGNSFGLAGQNYRLYYDGALASYSSGSSALSTTSYGNFTLVENIQNQNATGTGNLNFESNLSFLNYTIVLNNTTTGGSTLNNNWLTTSQVCFEVEPVLLSDPNRCLEVVWSRDGVTNPYATSFVEVSEWVQEGETQVATGGVYSDLSNNNNDACLADACPTVDYTYDIQLVPDRVDCSSQTACYDVQLRSTTGATWALAGQNYRLYYDASQATWISGNSNLSSSYTAFSLEEHRENINATGAGNLSFESTLSFLNYAIDLEDPSSNLISLPADGSWISTTTLCFEMASSQFNQSDICLDAVWSRANLTASYATSFVEVASCVRPDLKEAATANNYNDLTSSDSNDCIANNCQGSAQFGIQMSLNNANCATNTVCYDVQVNSIDGTNRGLAGQNYRLYYDASIASFQSGSSLLPSAYSSFRLDEDRQDINAGGTGNIPFESTLGFLNYSIELEDTENGGIQLPSDGTPLTTSQICFTVEPDVFNNPNVCFDAMWGRSGSTDAYATSFVEMAEWVSNGVIQEAAVLTYLDTPNNNCFANKATTTTRISETICEGSSYFFNNTSLTISGLYRMTLPGAVICDSIIELTLTVVPSLRGEVSETICRGETFTFNGNTYSETGSYPVDLRTSSGCDSTAVLNLTVESCIDLSLTKTLAPGQSTTVQEGDPVTYQICVSNSGVTPINNIIVTDSIPQGMVLSSGNTGWIPGAANIATYNIAGPIRKDQTACISITLDLQNVSSSSIRNVATIIDAFDETGTVIIKDETPENNTDTETIVFTTCPTVLLTPTSATICEGESLELEVIGAAGNATYTWENRGNMSCLSCQAATVRPAQTTTYIVTVTDPQGCEDIVSSTVSVLTPSTISVENQSICPGESATLVVNGANNAVSYSWSPSVGLSCPNCPVTQVSPSSTQTYCITVTDAQGCQTEDCAEVRVFNPVFASLGNDQFGCVGDRITLNSGGGTTYNWSPTTGLSNPNISNPSLTISNDITYTVTITNTDGCSAVDQVSVFIMDDCGEECTIKAVACPDRFICLGERTRLVVNGGSSWQWSPAGTLENPNSDAPYAFPSHTTTYFVTVTDRDGCTAVDEVVVNVDVDCEETPSPNCSTPAVACPDKVICQGGRTRLVVNGGSSWQWGPSTGLDNPSSDAPYAFPAQTTTYTVTVTDADGCTGTDQVIVTVQNNPQANAGADRTITAGSSTTLSASSGNSYAWSPTNSLNNAAIANPTASPSSTTVYTLTITNANGCSSTDQVTVFVNSGRLPGTNEDTEAIQLQAKVLLQGAIPHKSADPLMHDLLREKGLIPLQEPYTSLLAYEGAAPSFEHVGGGSEVINPSILDITGPDAIVDWVFIELRQAQDPTEVIATRSALVQRDGDIVEVDGVSPVSFPIDKGLYYVAIRHRNHLGTMTATPIPLNSQPQTLIDFSDPTTDLYSLEGSPKYSAYPVNPGDSYNSLWGGNANADDALIFQGPGVDQDKLFYDIYTHPDNISEDGVPNYNFIIKDYLLGDTNMDGQLKYQGPNNDIDNLMFFNILLHLENIGAHNNKIIYEQIPR